MTPALKAQMGDLAEAMQQAALALVRSMRSDLAAYEREHGPVKPAPPRAKTPKYLSKAQSMCLVKRELLRIGEYQAPEEGATP